MLLAELLSPQSSLEARCPPHASTAVELSAVKVTEITDSVASSVAYATLVMVPPKRVITLSLASSALKLAVATVGDAKLGAGIA